MPSVRQAEGGLLCLVRHPHRHLSHHAEHGHGRFSLALYENRRLVENILDRYCDWVIVVAERVCQMGFDIFISTDDMAFKSAPFFSPPCSASW